MNFSTFTVVFDACILYPAPLRDLLMRLATSGRFRARWSHRIHEEWKRNLLINRPDLNRELLDRTSARMDAAVADSVVEGYESLIDNLTLPDPADRHVLAAAIHCGASVIVTFNLRDFPAESLRPFGIEAQHPDEFIENLADLDMRAVLTAAQRQRRAMTAPPMNVERFLDAISRAGLRRTALLLLAYRSLL